VARRFKTERVYRKDDALSTSQPAEVTPCVTAKRKVGRVPDGSMSRYFDAIRPLLTAIEGRAALILTDVPSTGAVRGMMMSSLATSGTRSPVQ
jgi:hypothetical protein